MLKKRKTKETDISMEWWPDPNGENDIRTGLGMLDHMLDQLAFHANWTLRLQVEGDLNVDEHHTVEDVAIVLGDVLREHLLGMGKNGFARYGQSLLPMDETLVLVSIDLCQRANFVTDLSFNRPTLGQLSTEMIPHFFKTLSERTGMTLHIKQMWSQNTHHLVEACFKGVGRALRQALTPSDKLETTKGIL